MIQLWPASKLKPGGVCRLVTYDLPSGNLSSSAMSSFYDLCLPFCHPRHVYIVSFLRRSIYTRVLLLWPHFQVDKSSWAADSDARVRPAISIRKQSVMVANDISIMVNKWPSSGFGWRRRKREQWCSCFVGWSVEKLHCNCLAITITSRAAFCDWRF